MQCRDLLFVYVWLLPLPCFSKILSVFCVLLILHTCLHFARELNRSSVMPGAHPPCEWDCRLPCCFPRVVAKDALALTVTVSEAGFGFPFSQQMMFPKKKLLQNGESLGDNYVVV